MDQSNRPLLHPKRSLHARRIKPSEAVQDLVSTFLEDDTTFGAAVKSGEEALQRGEYLTHEQVGRLLERFLVG